MHRPRHTRLAQDRSRQLRANLTVSEARLWSRIRSKQLGVRFRRQVPLDIWIVDFASLDPKIVIEVDDKILIEVDDHSHDYRNEVDRTRYLETEGFQVLRFTNKEFAMDLDDVVKTIGLAIRA